MSRPGGQPRRVLLLAGDLGDGNPGQLGVRVCGRCAALVASDGMGRHQSWHRSTLLEDEPDE